MTNDFVAELMRHLLLEALILAAPVLIAAAAISFVISLVQTLTSLQDQTLSTVPRLVAVTLLMLAGMPWFIRRVLAYTFELFRDFHRYLG